MRRAFLRLGGEVEEDGEMQVTLDLDEGVIAMAERVAAAEGVTLGEAVGSLVERGGRVVEFRTDPRTGFLVMHPPPGSVGSTGGDTRWDLTAIEEDDARRYFAGR